jgi:RNA polymerase sigma factor (sigma-70 family)
MPDPPRLAPKIELALVARARSGRDRNAFSQLVRLHQSKVRAQLRRLAGADQSWADDLAQEAFLHAWRKLDQFRGQARFSTWLHCIAYTTFLQAVRRRTIKAEYAFDDRGPGLDESRQHALATDMASAMRHLTAGEQLALLHCYQLDLTHDEAALVLGVPVGTVKTNISRGKAKLRESLRDWNPAVNG